MTHIRHISYFKYYILTELWQSKKKVKDKEMGSKRLFSCGYAGC